MRYTYDSNSDHAAAAGGIGLAGALVAVAAFGLGYYLGLRRFGEDTVGEWIGEPGRDHWSRDAASPPSAEVLIGDQLSHKSARDSAAILYDQDGRPLRREHAAAGGHG